MSSIQRWKERGPSAVPLNLTTFSLLIRCDSERLAATKTRRSRRQTINAEIAEITECRSIRRGRPAEPARAGG